MLRNMDRALGRLARLTGALAEAAQSAAKAAAREALAGTARDAVKASCAGRAERIAAT